MMTKDQFITVYESFCILKYYLNGETSSNGARSLNHLMLDLIQMAFYRDDITGAELRKIEETINAEEDALNNGD